MSKKINTNSSIGRTFKKGKEPFEVKKFLKIFDLGDGVEWIKSIKEIVDLRKLIIYGIIVSCIFGYGYWKGNLNRPVKMNLDYTKEFKLDLTRGEYLHKPKNSNDLYIKDSKTGNTLKHIKAKDFPLLAEKLRPIGLELVPIAVVGGSLGESGASIEGGAGVSFARYWKMRLQAFLTNKGIYVGTAYKVTDNSGAGIAIGKGYKGDNRLMFYYMWEF